MTYHLLSFKSVVIVKYLVMLISILTIVGCTQPDKPLWQTELPAPVEGVRWNATNFSIHHGGNGTFYVTALDYKVDELGSSDSRPDGVSIFQYSPQGDLLKTQQIEFDMDVVGDQQVRLFELSQTVSNSISNELVIGFFLFTDNQLFRYDYKPESDMVGTSTYVTNFNDIPDVWHIIWPGDALYVTLQEGSGTSYTFYELQNNTVELLFQEDYSGKPVDFRAYLYDQSFVILNHHQDLGTTLKMKSKTGNVIWSTPLDVENWVINFPDTVPHVLSDSETLFTVADYQQVAQVDLENGSIINQYNNDPSSLLIHADSNGALFEYYPQGSNLEREYRILKKDVSGESLWDQLIDLGDNYLNLFDAHFSGGDYSFSKVPFRTYNGRTSIYRSTTSLQNTVIGDMVIDKEFITEVDHESGQIRDALVWIQLQGGIHPIDAMPLEDEGFVVVGKAGKSSPQYVVARY